MKHGSQESRQSKTQRLQVKGVTYDTGFFHAGVSTRETFDPAVVKREMQIIHDDLHCNAVRITGGNADRLEQAAIYAASTGLQIWFSPFTCDLTCDELLDFLDNAAARAEQLRQQGAEIVFLTGSELSLFTRGFLPGETLAERLDLLAAPGYRSPGFAQIALRLNEVLGQAVARARERFHGIISYASIPTEGVDWRPFDFIGIDAYYAQKLADQYRAGIRALLAQGKPVAITECGCATFQGASTRSGSGGMIVTYESGRPVRLNGDYIRNEAEQAAHLRELLDVVSAEGVDAVFVNTFVSYHLPHRRDPHLDLDLASYGLVRVLEERPAHSYAQISWEPKAAFTALAALYSG
jgi:hypothetical protein